MWDYCNDLFKLLLNLPKNWCSTGLIDGYADEKAFLEKQLQEKIDVIDHLEQELLCTGNKLQELEAEQQQIQEEKELLARQKDAMRADAGPVEQRMYFPQSFYKIFLFLSKIMSDPGEIVCLVFYPFLIVNKNMKWQNVTFSHLVPNVSEITLQDGWTKKKVLSHCRCSWSKEKLDTYGNLLFILLLKMNISKLAPVYKNTGLSIFETEFEALVRLPARMWLNHTWCR